MKITQHISKLVCLVVLFPASIVQKGDTHIYTQQLHRILGNICPPKQMYWVPTSPFLFISPEFSKWYLQEGLCWQTEQSINRASGTLKELCLISAGRMIAKKWHVPWNNDKEHCPRFLMQNLLLVSKIISGTNAEHLQKLQPEEIGSSYLCNMFFLQ